MYNFVGCLGVEFVQFQGLLLEASGDLFYQISLREMTLSGSYSFTPNGPLPVFSLTVGVDDVAKVAGIWRFRVPRPSGQEMGHISNRHVIPNQVFVVFKGNFHNCLFVEHHVYILFVGVRLCIFLWVLVFLYVWMRLFFFLFIQCLYITDMLILKILLLIQTSYPSAFLRGNK